MNFRHASSAWVGTLATNAAILGSGLISGVLAARLLGPEQRGLLAVLVFWPGLIAGVGYLSLREALAHRVAQQGEDDNIAASGLALSMLLSLVVIIFGLILLPYALTGERASWLIAESAYLLVFVPFNFAALTLLALDHGAQRFARFNLLRLVPSWIYVAGLLVLWATDTIDARTALFANASGTVLTAVVRLWLHRGQLCHPPKLSAMRGLLHTSIAFHWAAMIALLSGQLDRIILMTLFGDRVIGQYVVAFTLASAGLGVLTQSVSLVLFPRLATLQSVRDRARLLARAMGQVLVLLAAAATAIAVLTPWLLMLLFGSEFAAAVPLAWLLEIACLPLAVRHIGAATARAFGDGRTGAETEGVALALLALTGPLLAVRMGPPGLALALVLSNLGATLWLARVMERRHAILMRTFLLPRRTDFLEVATRACRLVGACTWRTA